MTSGRLSLDTTEACRLSWGKYWLESKYKASLADSEGDTDALGPSKRKAGRPKRDEGPAVRLFLEDENSIPMSAVRLSQAAEKFKALANSLYQAGLAPSTWMQKTDDVQDYMHRQMRAAFIEFALCEGDWKGEMYFVTAYPRWAHCKDFQADNTSETKKRKRSQSVFNGLTKMEDDPAQDAMMINEVSLLS